MKKVLLAAALFAGLFAAATPALPVISEKAIKAFNETFASAKDVSWHEYTDYVQVNFRQDLVQVRAQYDEEGRLLRTIRYYGETQLMPNIVAKLKKKYAGKEITGVTETSSDEEVSFVINLKDNDNWYIVKSDILGSLQQTEKFKRADK
jgi:hypothetical protein